MPRRRAAKPAARVGPAAVALEVSDLASGLPETLRLGTSSWSFPGWVGIVYDNAAPVGVLARRGLAAYAQHPLFRMVGLDRTYYAPLTAQQFAAYGADVPPDFRFLVKAFEDVTTPARRAAGGGARIGSTEFLDVELTKRQIVAPLVEGLGTRAGPLVFQFAPLPRAMLREPARFIERLHGFLAALPRGPLYAVEIRNRELLGADYAAALADAGACHCYNVHPRMPSVAAQAAVCSPERGAAVVVRWMLNGRFDYEGARQAYEPFNRLVDEDPGSRAGIAELCGRAAELGRPAFIAANNKAEGCAPLTLIKLAEEIVCRRRPARVSSE